MNNSKVTEMLLRMGFKCSHMGYKYLRELIILYISGNNILPLKSNGYTYLSRKYHKTLDAIDKSIQNAISYVWENGDVEYVYEIFCYTISENKGKPTNKQFIMTISDKIST